jgi:hypothetical protein
MNKQDRAASALGLAPGVPPPPLAERSGEGTPFAPPQRPAARVALDRFLDPLIAFFTSLRLTVVCLACGLVLVFFGTMAQDPIGLFLAQDKFFRSFFVTAAPMWAGIKKTLQMLHIYLPPSTAADVLHGPGLPVFPGGYLVGGILLINLVASHFKRFSFSSNKTGIWMVHAGLILLLLGQLGTDLLSRETTLHLREGEARNYSETQRTAELAVIDTTDAEADKVVAIPQGVLQSRSSIQRAELPFTIRVKQFYPNSSVENRSTNSVEPPAATQDIGVRAVVKDLPRVTDMEKRDVPSAVVEVMTPQGSLGTWLVSEFIERPQSFTCNNRSYQLVMRPRRYYKPYSIQLLKFQHDIYAGTDIPKNFSSRVLLDRPETGEKREVLIYMNKPLRYAGETYYQASYDEDNHGSILQVVHNPGWLTPYFSCVLVGVGLIVQFATHLLGFTIKRRPA